MQNSRLNQILSILKGQGKVNVADLSIRFAVSQKTIRRDLLALEKQGEVVRIHGGAELTKTDILRDKPFGLRLNINPEKKIMIGKLASTLLESGQKIFIGAGSTLDYFSSSINNQNRLSVVTDSITVVNQLNNRSEIDIFMLGGDVTKHVLGTSGTIAESILKTFWFDKAFVSATKMDEEGRLFHRGNAEYGIYRNLTEHSRQLIALVDSTKLGQKDFINVSQLRPGDILVTDNGITEELLKKYKDYGINVMIAE